MLCLLRKTDLLFIKNIRSFIDVYSIVAYSLILWNKVEKRCNSSRLILVQTAVVELYKIWTYSVLKPIDKLLTLFYLVDRLKVILVIKLSYRYEIFLCQHAHLNNCLCSLCDSNVWSNKKSVVKKILLSESIIVLSVLLISDSPFGKLFKHCIERQKDYSYHNIEDSMEVCDASRCKALIPERKSYCILNDINANKKDYSTDKIEIEVYHSGSLSVLWSTYTWNKRCSTSTDVSTHYNRKCRSECDSAWHWKRLQNAYRSGWWLYDSREYRTHQYTQNRVFKHCKKLLELRKLCQRSYLLLHKYHSGKEDTYAHHYLAHVLCLVLLSHHYNYKTDNDKYRREVRRLAKLQYSRAAAVALQVCEPQYLRCHGRSDIRTHDYSNCAL